MGNGCEQPCTCPLCLSQVVLRESSGMHRDKELPDGAGHRALPGEPVALPRGWHCPLAEIILMPFQGCQLCLHPVHGVGVLGLGGKWDDDPKPAPNP